MKGIIATTLILAAGVVAAQQRLTGEQVFKLASPSVVTIRTDVGSGSGFVVDVLPDAEYSSGWTERFIDVFIENGFAGPETDRAKVRVLISRKSFVVTSYHVIAGAERIEVELDDELRQDVVAVFGFSRDTDLAVLVLDKSLDRGLRLANYDSASPGATVYVIGNPLGILDDSITAGILSKKLDLTGVRLVQISAAINPGNSGGPILSDRAEVLGVVKGAFAELQAINIGVAVPEVYSALLSSSPVAYKKDLPLPEMDDEEGPSTWDKPIAPGVTYWMEYDAETPRIVHAILVGAWSNSVSFAAELAQEQVFNPGQDDQGRETVSAMAARAGALVAMNADFFPLTGDPLGAMVVAGELVSAPVDGRAAFYWGEGHAQAGYLTFAARLLIGDEIVRLDGLNEECRDDMVVLNTPRAGFATSRDPATHAILELPDRIAPVGSWTAKFKRFVFGSTSVPVAEGEVVLTLLGEPEDRLSQFGVGDEIQIQIAIGGADWSTTTDVVGGGPFLVREGNVFIPYANEGFTEGFASNRHPRTAIGRTEVGDVWLVTVDGRQTMSAGASLQELAHIMLRLGCVEAINLDGGGSTALAVYGVVLNRPSGGQERAVAGSVLVFGLPGPVFAIPPPSDALQSVIAGRAVIQIGETAQYRLVDFDGEPVPHGDVLWVAEGAGWVDQAGVLRPIEEGEVLLRAIARGWQVSITVTVEAEKRP
ncbi:MAG: phosphodiester glycosidase family protein [Armatimonadetes bacterium]|nr:phosphodiester glycosidase family protein [Armatimonadota bacterium]